jgi:acetolactate synthase small subunit
MMKKVINLKHLQMILLQWITARDFPLDSFTFQITGTPEKVDAFAELMRPLGLIEIARTGVAALSRG